MIAAQDLKDAFEAGHCLTLISDQRDGNSDYFGYIVGLSDHFVMLQTVEDWHSNGIQVFPLTRLHSLELSDVDQARMKILAFNGVGRIDGYDWVNLSSFVELLWSLKSNDRTVFLSDNDEAEVGDILDVKKTHLTLKAIDAMGLRVEEPVEFYYSNITYVQFDDEYTRVLKKYADRDA